MKLTYNYLILIFIFFTSCKTVQVATDKTQKNTPSIGIEYAYVENFNTILKKQSDSLIENFIKKFNSENHSFSIHKKRPDDRDYIIINFVKGRILGKGAKAVNYIVNGLGMIALPIYMIIEEVGFVAIVGYWSNHKLYTTVNLSPSLSSQTNNTKLLFHQTGALFSKDSRQIKRLMQKLEKSLYQTFSKIERQLQ